MHEMVEHERRTLIVLLDVYDHLNTEAFDPERTAIESDAALALAGRVRDEILQMPRDDEQ